jgi:thiamine biosynthesis lipoprotein
MPQHKLVFEALGTQWTIESLEPLGDTLQKDVMSSLATFDKTYSRFRDDSLVGQMAAQSGTYKFPDDFRPLMAIYLKCYELTDGRMTPLIGSALEQAGYDKSYRLRAQELSAIPDFHEVISWDKARTVTTSRPVTFDIGAAGKGYAVDKVAALLEGAGIDTYVIDASGDIRHQGDKQDTVGLEHPTDASKVIGVAHLQNQSLCASASNRRRWGDFHHIFDPHTLTPVRDVVASWVVADDTLIADAMATALFLVKDTTELMKTFEFSYVRMFADGRVEHSANFKGELFP